MKDNIKKVEFIDKWPNGRPYKHGAMKIYFYFPPAKRQVAVREIRDFMTEHGYKQSEDYHIPAWNWPGFYSTDFYGDTVTITFTNDQQFVMAKLSWDNQDAEF